MNSDLNTVLPIIAMLATAAAAGLAGVFALTRRMTLAADSMSHIALPGLGLALVLKINPLIGGAAALVLGAFLIWSLERRTRIAIENIIGVIFSVSLAVGALLIQADEDLLDALFGNFSALTSPEAIFGIGLALVIIYLFLVLKSKFTLSFISKDLANTVGVSVAKLDLVFLLMFVATIILGLNFLGALLMGSLVIIPAATSRNLARSFKVDLAIAASAAILSILFGLLISNYFGTELGPTIISVAAGLFFVSVSFKKPS